MSDRIENLEEAQRDMQRTMQDHGQQIAVLNSHMPMLQQALQANTQALDSHGKILSEYSGARKMIHWVVTAGAALGSYFLGSQGKG